MGGTAWSSPQKAENSVSEETENVADAVPVEIEKQEVHDGNDDAESKSEVLEEDFDTMLERKREQRHEAISRISEEMKKLRQCQEDLESERSLRIGLERQVKALKEVSTVSNEMLQLRESQVTELKKRLQNLESISEENLTKLRTQYENQIENIRKLRILYEERAEAAAKGHEKEMEKEQAKNTLLELKLEEYARDLLQKQRLEEKVIELEEALSNKQSELEENKEVRSSLVAECNNLTTQLTLVNNLFSNMLTGDMDFDLLTQMLQDNHNLISDLIANGDINDTVALLISIAEKSYKKKESTDETQGSLSTKEEIASNLPKVWRMLTELLSSHEDTREVQGTSDECYRHVKTATGSRTVISVSQTFLRLKDLILEKNSLVKEVGRLKTLNGTLENRLDIQEKRLGVVTSELRKTWAVVSKLKLQHRQLHTHEKILRYELKHKRQMLTELKHELEYCKETWDRAKEKNIQTEHDWEILRKEFALRKTRDVSNSAESGYEDEENSQSPDLSASDIEYDLSDSQRSTELEDNASMELEDAASDATVIELIDMLDLDADEQDESAPETVDVITDESIPDNNLHISDSNNNLSLISHSEDTSSSQIEERSSSHDVNQCESSSRTDDAIAVTEDVPRSRSSEEILEARSNRLRRLEQQCCSLMNQMALTSLRSDTLSSRLEELHELYGSENRVRFDPSSSVPHSNRTSRQVSRQSSSEVIQTNSSPTSITTEAVSNSPESQEIALQTPEIGSPCNDDTSENCEATSDTSILQDQNPNSTELSDTTESDENKSNNQLTVLEESCSEYRVEHDDNKYSNTRDDNTSSSVVCEPAELQQDNNCTENESSVNPTNRDY